MPAAAGILSAWLEHCGNFDVTGDVIDTALLSSSLSVAPKMGKVVEELFKRHISAEWEAFNATHPRSDIIDGDQTPVGTLRT